MSGEANQVRWRGVRQIVGVDGVWPAANAVRVNKHLLQTGDSTVIIYTVPAGKKLYISNAGLASSLSANAYCRTLTYVRDENDVTKYAMMFHQFDIAGHQASFVNCLPALEVLAGWDCCVEGNNAGLHGRGFVFGWLEDA